MDAKIVLNKVMDLKIKSIESKNFGPWIVCIPSKWNICLDEVLSFDFMESPETLKHRLFRIGNIQKILVVKNSNNIQLINA